jgi:hypothetical protein
MVSRVPAPIRAGLRFSTTAALLASALLPAVIAEAAPATPAAVKEIVLRGPEVVKLDWNTRALQAVDLNGDKKLDLAVINNDRSAIDLLFQLKPGETVEKPARGVRVNRWEPVLEDARFRKSSVTTGLTVFDLVVADFNGDGRKDLAYTGEPQPLTLRLQEADGSWTEKRVTEAPTPSQMVGSFRAGDLDGDGRTDLAVLGQKELAVFFQEKDGGFAPPDRYALPDDNCFGLELVDVNGDKQPDLVYLCGTHRDGLRVRLQAEKRQFGPEQAYPMKPSRCTLQILQQAGPNKAAVFAFAQQATGQFEEFKLEPAKSGESSLVLRPRVFSPRQGSKTTAGYAVGDFNGDGQADVAVSDPDGAQVFLFLRQRNGGFTRAQRFPVYADCRSIAAADWDGDGRAELFVASLKEQSLGVSVFSKEGRLAYPQPLPLAGRPLAIAVEAGPSGALIAVVRDEKGKRFLDLMRRKDDSAEVVKSLELAGLKTDPRSVRFMDINQDGRSDVLVFSPLEPIRIFLQDENSGYTDLNSAAGFRRGLVDNVDPSAVSVGDVADDSKPELIISSGNFARALRVNAKNELIVVDQFNARDSTSEVSAAFALATEKGKKSTVLLYDRKTESFQVLKHNEQGLYQVSESTPAGKIEIVGAEVLSQAAGGAEAFVWGRDRFWWLPLGRGDFELKTVATHTTDLPEIHYSDVIAGDLTGDGAPEVVCVDPDKNALEILAREGDRWESRLHFKVFETDEHFQGRKGPPQEPRETLVADVTGDGKNDLILLVHDRILVYPRE